MSEIGNNADKMNASTLVLLTEPVELQKGQLIGFKGLGEERGITAAYSVFRTRGDEILFVLGHVKDKGPNFGRPILDNCWFGNHNVFTNDPPIIVMTEMSDPQTIHQRLNDLMP